MKLYAHTQYPGYYISLKEKQVYSIKSGELKPLKLSQRYNGPGRPWGPKGFQMSHKGIQRFIQVEELHHYCDRTGTMCDLMLPIKKAQKS